MKKTVCVCTATRAEWGLLRPLAQKIKESAELELLLAVTGAHFCAAYGNTYQEILSDGFSIDERIDIQLYPESPAAVSKTMALAMMGFADMFSRRNIDLLVVLGDRYETIAICLAAMNSRIPIAHIHGGETTEGAIDEGIRHAITKLSSLHFTCCEEYRRRVIQLGEQPDRVYNTGALSIDNILSLPCIDTDELNDYLGFDILHTPYAVVTFHPVTLENSTAEDQCEQLFAALLAKKEYHYIITKSNADLGGDTINNLMDGFASENPQRVRCVSSLGARRYFSTLRYAKMAIGNSSSGILEVPALRIPTVNIGDRQRGRLQAPSIINCAPQKSDIIQAMDQAMHLWKDGTLEIMQLPYGDGRTSERITKSISDALSAGIELKKKFYNIEITEGEG